MCTWDEKSGVRRERRKGRMVSSNEILCLCLCTMTVPVTLVIIEESA